MHDVNRWLFLCMCCLGMAIKALIEEDDDLRELVDENKNVLYIDE